MVEDNCNSEGLFNIFMDYARCFGFDESFFSNDKTFIPACPDQSVGKIKDFKDWDVFQRRDITESYGGAMGAKGRVVLILESPHRDEYERTRDNLLVAQGPAYGCTGCKIRRYFNLITKKVYEDYELLLVNVIQYPCSLFKRRAQGGGEIRDKMIRRLLRHEEKGEKVFMECLRSRVKLAIDRGQNLLVINACTQVGKQKISKPLSEILPPHANYATADHPSFWCEKTTLKYLQGGQNGIS